MHRRQFLRLGMSLLAAPAIVRATSLMQVRPFIENDDSLMLTVWDDKYFSE